MTIEEIEEIEDRARRGAPIEPQIVLRVTAHLRNVLQAKSNAEAFACEVARKAGLTPRYYYASHSQKPKER